MVVHLVGVVRRVESLRRWFPIRADIGPAHSQWEAANQEDGMLICPHCEKQVTPPPGGEWLLCPHCELPIRKQVNKNGHAELQPGMRYTKAIRVLQYLSNKPEGQPVIKANPKSPQYDLKELLIPFEKIDGQLANVQRQKTEIYATKQELGRKINILTKSSEQRERFHDEVEKLSNEYEARDRYVKQLMEVKTFVSTERNKAKMDSSIPVSAGSLFLAIGGLVLFAWAGGVAWDWRTIGMSILIAIATPLVMYNVASSN
jgi:hypothetical protein